MESSESEFKCDLLGWGPLHDLGVVFIKHAPSKEVKLTNPQENSVISIDTCNKHKLVVVNFGTLHVRIKFMEDDCFCLSL